MDSMVDVRGFCEIGEIQGIAKGMGCRSHNLTQAELVKNSKRIQELAEYIAELLHEVMSKKG